MRYSHSEFGTTKSAHQNVFGHILFSSYLFLMHQGAKLKGIYMGTWSNMHSPDVVGYNQFLAVIQYSSKCITVTGHAGQLAITATDGLVIFS